MVGCLGEEIDRSFSKEASLLSQMEIYLVRSTNVESQDLVTLTEESDKTEEFFEEEELLAEEPSLDGEIITVEPSPVLETASLRSSTTVEDSGTDRGEEVTSCNCGSC